MQQDADFITAGFLYMFRMTELRSTSKYNNMYRWLPCQYFILLMMSA